MKEKYVLSKLREHTATDRCLLPPIFNVNSIEYESVARYFPGIMFK